MAHFIEKLSSGGYSESDFSRFVKSFSQLINARKKYHENPLFQYLIISILEELGASEEDKRNAEYIAEIYDFGLLLIEEDLLDKKTLSAAEKRSVKSHPYNTVLLLDSFEYSEDVKKTVLHHHERFDGSGYPDGLQGEEIPFLARVIAVVDSFCAMLENRPYRKRMPGKRRSKRSYRGPVRCMTLLLQGRSRSLCGKIGRGRRRQSSIADAPEIACMIMAWKGGNALKEEFELLKKIQLFSSVNDRELRQISDKIMIKLFKKNEAILREEDTNEYMYTILSGRVKVIQISEDGRESVLALHGAGDFFGEMSLIDGKTMPATILALEDTLTAIISKKEFSYLINQHERVLEKLLIILCSRLREAWERIQILNFNNASERMKMLFTLLSREYGEKNADGITLNIKLHPSDIANMVGITRETVTRVLDKWQKDREISILKNKRIHLNSDFLKRDFIWTVRK